MENITHYNPTVGCPAVLDAAYQRVDRGGGTHEVIGTGSQAHFRLVGAASCLKYVFSQEDVNYVHE